MGVIMKVLFLDIDGVLNSREYDRRRDWNAQTNIDETRLPLLKEITDKTGAKIVLTSSWRRHWNKDESLRDDSGRYIAKLFAKYGLCIYDKTPDFGIGAKRKDEITAWLSEYAAEAECAEQVERFVILDDYRFGWEEFSEYFICTNPNFGRGLEDEHVIEAIKLLNS